MSCKRSRRRGGYRWPVELLIEWLDEGDAVPCPLCGGVLQHTALPHVSAVQWVCDCGYESVPLGVLW